jgi:hypothetical protein
VAAAHEAAADETDSELAGHVFLLVGDGTAWRGLPRRLEQD